MRATSILNDFFIDHTVNLKNILSGGSLAVCEDSQEQAQRCETTSATVSRPPSRTGFDSRAGHTMNKKHLYNDKRPRAHALLPREHFAKKNGAWKPKRAFVSELSARLYLSTQMCADGYQAYRCTVCGKWHVGKYVKDGDSLL
jgi:hypothetical protein